MAALHITDIESAINWWRQRSPSPDGITACAEVRALAEVYGLMVYYHEVECDEDTMPAKARDAWLAWYASTPDAPCIAICSTSQGDDVCKGCGRTFAEVQHWTVMTPGEKRATWRRITMDSTAWRFNKYAERAQERTLDRTHKLAEPVEATHATHAIELEAAKNSAAGGAAQAQPPEAAA